MPHSFWLNFEVTLFIYDDDFSSAMQFLQGGYLAERDEVHPSKSGALQPRWEVFRDNVAQLLGPCSKSCPMRGMNRSLVIPPRARSSAGRIGPT